MTGLIGWSPQDRELKIGLDAVLRSEAGDSYELLHRRPFPRSSTFPCEVLTVRLGDDPPIEILCKFGVVQQTSGFGHRGGVSFEGSVFREVLSTTELSLPTFYGIYLAPPDNTPWLFLEFLGGSKRVSSFSNPSAMIAAARWIGRFHAEARESKREFHFPWIPCYGSEYYRGWIERTIAFAGTNIQRYPWLRTLQLNAAQIADQMGSYPTTLIHGEYTPHNVLIKDNTIFPVDWESVAYANGLTDLAMLVDGWSLEVTNACENEYVATRWPEGAPSDHLLALASAQLYIQFRWLGDRQHWTLDEHRSWRFDLLKSYASNLGYL